MTLHAAKGLEFPVVFLVQMEDGIFRQDARCRRWRREERRCGICKITRAEKKHLYDVHSHFFTGRHKTIVSLIHARN